MKKNLVDKSALTNPWAKVLLALAVELVVVGIWYAAVYSPMRTRATFLSSQRELLDGKVEVAVQAATQIQSLQSRIDSLRQEIDGIHRRLFTADEMDRAVAHLARTAKVCGMTFESVEPDFEVLLEGGKDGVVAPLPVKVHAVATYFSLGKFLDGLPQLPFFFEPNELSVTYDPILYPRLRIELGATLYLKGEGEGEEQPATGTMSSGQL